jgi:glycosyltransferase involved in cell wall biosynthesis
MKKQPKISVLMPVYNQEKLVDRALNSIPKGKDIEVIIYNDGSSDDSFAIADRWRTRNKGDFYKIAVINSDQNKGVAFAMNRLFDMATGEYIVSLSSDDYYLTDFEEFRPLLDGENDLIFFDLEVNDGSVWHTDESNKDMYVGAVKFIRRKFLGDTRVPDKKWEEDIPFTQELYSKNPKMVFTGIVLKKYNWPHEGSLSWQKTHQN